jgi:uncharacterized membrane protein YphA (DoxX/SURF4 family)
MEYVLDGTEKVPVEGNLTLHLPNGNHTLTVYATDEAGNVGASETISFSVDAPFPTALVAVVSEAFAGAFLIVGLLVYFKKRKRRGGL